MVGPGEMLEKKQGIRNISQREEAVLLAGQPPPLPFMGHTYQLTLLGLASEHQGGFGVSGLEMKSIGNALARCCTVVCNR